MKILFVGLDYHSYTEDLTAEMRLQGGDVTYIDIAPRSTALKVFRTLAPVRYAAFLRRHHKEALRAAAKQRFDIVVFLQAHQVELTVLEEFRASQPDVPFVLYNWDSLSTHDYRPQAKLFDHVFTFDREDATTHGFLYLPLFATREMQALRRDRAQARSVYTVGNIVNPQRYHAIRAFQAHCKAEGIAFEAFMKITPVVFARMLAAGKFPVGVSLRSIPTKRFHKMIEKSQAVFDFANHQQSGHTMRTVENLCCGKKVITNNKRVLGEEFYSPDRFMVYEEFDFSGLADFLEAPLEKPEDRFDEYSIQKMVRRLLLLSPPNLH